MAQGLLYYGSNRSRRGAALDRILAEHWGRAVLLTPTHASAARRLDRVLRQYALPGAWGRPVCEFNSFVESLLRAEHVLVRRLDDFERELLLANLLESIEHTAELNLPHSRTGLARHLLRTITGLKQAAVEPAHFRSQVLERGGATALDALVAEAYDAYQQELRRRGAYDVPGLYWEAELRCRQGKPRLLETIDVLLLDGFDDFTPSQLRLLETLAQHLGRIVFGIRYNPDTGQDDLYVLARNAVAAIRKAFDTSEPREDTRDHPAATSFIEHAADHLFWRHVPEPAQGLEKNLAVVPCTDVQHEAETIGRAVKRLVLNHHVAPESIAVAFRGLSEAAPVLREVFQEFGIPLRLQHAPPLTQSMVGAFAARLLEMFGAWERDTTLDVLASPLLGGAAEPAGHRDAFPLIARRAQIIGGYEEWTQRLEALAQRAENGTGEDIEAFRRRLPEANNAVAALRASLEKLRALTQTLPVKGPPAEMAAALDRLLNDLDTPNRVTQLPEDLVREESAALAAFRRVLDALAQAGGPPLSRAEFCARVAEGMRQTAYSWPQSRAGVYCCDAPGLRNLSFDYVFFGGLNEGVIPAPPASSAVYGQADLERLHNLGVVLEDNAKRSARERVLFHHVLESAEKELTLLWRLQKEDGREAMPSLLLGELETLFPPGALPSTPIPRADAFVPCAESAASPRDLRNTVFLRHPDSRAALGEEVAPLRLGHDVEQQRHSKAEFNEFDGVLRRPELIRHVAARFGDQHHFSAHQIETHLNCPFRFFAGMVLRIEETEPPAQEFDARVRGLVLHDALESLHRAYAGRALAEVPPDELDARAQTAVADAFEKHGWKSAAAPRAIVTVEQCRMEEQVARYARIEREHGDANWKPSHFEVGFGRAPGDTVEPPSATTPFVFRHQDLEAKFAGRIDRVDLQSAEEASPPQVRIVDYKTSRAPETGDIAKGRCVQLTLYAWAVEALVLPESECLSGAFVVPGKRLGKRNPYREAIAMGKKGEDREPQARQNIHHAITAIRAGQFPPVRYDKKQCEYCPCKDACRFERARIERKTGQVREEDENE